MAQYQQPLYPPHNAYQYPQQVYNTPDYLNQPVPFPQPAPGPAGHTPIPRPKKFSRHTNDTTTNYHDQRPLKSAMKRTSARSDVGRARRGSHQSRRDSEEKRRGRDPLRDQINGGVPIPVAPPSRRSLSRQRTNSRVAFIPDHVFVSFRRDDELHVTNLIDDASLESMAESIMNMWPDGHDEIVKRRNKWRVKFRGSPWASSSGSEGGIAARRIIRNVFAAMASLGFSYSTVTNSSAFNPPSLIFSRVPVEVFSTQTTDFFILSISRNQRRWTFIEAPEAIVRNLGIDLKQYFPYQVASDRLAEHGMLELEIKDRVKGTPKLDRYLFVAWLLQYISMKGGYALEASVPLGKRRYGGLGGRKEVWVFRRRGNFQGQYGV